MYDLLPVLCKIEKGLLKNIVNIIFKKFDKIEKILIVSDENVYKMYGNIIYNDIKNKK